jgi:hypothetical protein
LVGVFSNFGDAWPIAPKFGPIVKDADRNRVLNRTSIVSLFSVWAARMAGMTRQKGPDFAPQQPGKTKRPHESMTIRKDNPNLSIFVGFRRKAYAIHTVSKYSV